MTLELIDKAILELLNSGIRLKYEDLEEIIKDTYFLIEKNKDLDEEELIHKFFDEEIKKIDDILINNPKLMGYAISYKLSNFNVDVYSGYKNYHKDSLIDNNTLFDMASITKMFSQIITYNLIKEGYIDIDKSVKYYVSDYKYLDDLKIKDIIYFSSKLMTDKRLDECSSKEEAKEVLYNTKLVEKGIYNYNDIGMMILKDVLEKVSGKTFEELFDEYIINKLNLKNTFLKVEEDRFKDLTGTPNFDKGLPNDPKAVVFGGFSGHAGSFSSSNDLANIAYSIEDKTLVDNNDNFYKVNPLNKEKALYGNLSIHQEDNFKNSFVGSNVPLKSFVSQGSTRSEVLGSTYNLEDEIYLSRAICTNPNSMSLEDAKRFEKIYNEERIKEGKKPLKLIKKFHANQEDFYLFDIRLIFKPSEVINKAKDELDKLNIKLIILDKVFEKENAKKQSLEIKVR